MPRDFVKNIFQNKFTAETIAYCALFCYVLDVALLGTGDITKIAGISTRMLFLAVALFASIPLVIRNYKKILKNKGVVLVAVFFGALLLSAIYGILRSNQMSILIGDVKGYLNFLIVIPMICTLTNKDRLMKLLKAVLWLIVIQCALSIFFSYLEIYPEPLSDFLYEHVNKRGIGILTGITTRSARVFLYSGSRMAGMGVLVAFVLWILERKHLGIRYLQMVSCMVLDFFSYGRAIYLGLALMAVLFLIAVLLRYREYLLETIKTYIGVLALTAVVLVLVGCTQQTNLFKAAMDRCLVAVMSDTILQPEIADSVDMNIGNLKAEVESIEVRDEREEIALDNYSKNPIIGNGLGLVNDSNNETIEYFYLDLLSKMGIIGLVLFLLPALWAFYTILKCRDEYGKEQRLLSLACWFGLLFLMVISYFNPCMNTSWGLMIYGLVIAISISWKENIGD